MIWDGGLRGKIGQGEWSAKESRTQKESEPGREREMNRQTNRQADGLTVSQKREGGRGRPETKKE